MKRSVRSERRRPAYGQRGFTLIELLVAIAILAVVAVLAWRGLDQIILGRDTIMRTMADERVVAQFFDQIEADARQAVTDDEVGEPAIRMSEQQLQIVRTLRVAGQPPRLQVVRYRQADGRITRYASAPLDNLAQLRGALRAGVDAGGWSALALLDGVTDMRARVWVPQAGWTNQMKQVDDAIQLNANNLKIPQLGDAPLSRAVTGIEVRVMAGHAPAPLVRVFLVGE